VHLESTRLLDSKVDRSFRMILTFAEQILPFRWRAIFCNNLSYFCSNFSFISVMPSLIGPKYLVD